MSGFAQTYKDGVRRAWTGPKGQPAPKDDVWERVRTVELRIEPGLTSPCPDILVMHANESDFMKDGRPMEALTRLVRRALALPGGRPVTPWVDLSHGHAEWELHMINDPDDDAIVGARRIIEKLTNWWGLEVHGLPGTGLEEPRFLAGDLQDPDWQEVLQAIKGTVRQHGKRSLVEVCTPGLA